LVINKRIAAGAAALVVLAAVGVTVGVVGSAGGTPYDKPPKLVLGRSVHPLVIFERANRMIATPHPTLGPHERELPPISGINPIVINRKPVISLHVDYARVIPSFGGSWRMNLAAREGTFFNGTTMRGHAYVAVIAGQAYQLFPLFVMNGPPVTEADEVQFAFGRPTQWPTEADALKMARSLTTSVTVASCTTAQVEKYRCS
jgi:hypothetical protein